MTFWEWLDKQNVDLWDVLYMVVVALSFLVMFGFIDL